MRVNEEIEFIDDKHRVILRTRCKQDEEFADSYMLTPRDITRMVEYLKARL